MGRKRAAALVGLWLLAAGCHPGRPAVIIGTKDFTEQVILGCLAAQLVEARLPVRVVRQFNLGGTFICFTALGRGDLDCYPEYTGTALTEILKRQMPSDGRETVFRIVRKGLAGRGQRVLSPLGFNNTFALMMRAPAARRLGVKSISDLVAHAPVLSAAFTPEFHERPDGWRGLARAYGLAFRAKPRQMDPGLIYGALASGEVDVISGFATDGRIDKFHLALLEDDRKYFPPYEACFLVRTRTLERVPALEIVLERLSGLLSDRVMRGLNAAVDVEGRRPEDVAREFLTSHELIAPEPAK